MKLTSAERAYLAGICDGEGTITLHMQSLDRLRSPGSLICHCVAVAGSDGKLILHVVKLLKKAGIKPYVVCQSNTARPKWKAIWSVRLQTIATTKTYLRLIYPYLVSKAAQADLMLKFLANRQTGRWLARSAEDMLIYQELRRLNKRGTSESVETVRAAREKLTAMIQSELAGDSERPAEKPGPLFRIN